MIITSCSDDWMDLSPTTAVSTNNAFTSSADVLTVLNGAYSILQHPYYYGGFMQWYPEVTADDMQAFDVSSYSANAYRFLYTEDNIEKDYWVYPYKVLLSVNSLLENIDNISVETEEEVATLNDYKGQALAIRALCHFDLTRLFGMPYKKDNGASLGAALVKTTLNPADELPRNTVAECYEQIITDFKDAIELLPKTKTNGKINKYASMALLSKVYLYKGDNDEALKLAEDVIGSGAYSLLDTSDYVSAWSSGFSSESIFEIVQNTDDNGGHQNIGYHLDPSGYADLILTSEYISLIKEDTNDVRANLLSPFANKKDTIADIYLLKYPGKDGGETSVNNNIVIRLAEVYLIAAEAAYKTDEVEKARTYLNTLIENRNGIADYLSLSDITYDRIFKERRKELVCEGHRFFDAIRDGNTLTRNYDGFFGEVSTIDWNDYRVVLPIPIAERNANSNMVQNDEY